MDIEKFKGSTKGSRLKSIIEFCEQQTDWFSRDSLRDHVKESKIRKPQRTKGEIKFLVKIGYLMNSKEKGLKRNPNFVPLSQR